MLHLYSAWTLTGVTAFFQKEIFVDIYSRKPPRTILGFFVSEL